MNKKERKQKKKYKIQDKNHLKRVIRKFKGFNSDINNYNNRWKTIFKTTRRAILEIKGLPDIHIKCKPPRCAKKR